MFFLSSGFRNQRTISRIRTYHNYQNIRNLDFTKINKEQKLKDFFVASAYNPCNTKKPMLDYTSIDVFKNILQSGARYIEVKVFNNKFGSNAEPVISNGFSKGEWKLTLNNIRFEDFCKCIVENAFEINKKLENNDMIGVPNYEDPLFIGLNLHTKNNPKSLNIMADLILKYFGGKLNLLLSSRYRNLNFDMANINMKDLKKNSNF